MFFFVKLGLQFFTFYLFLLNCLFKRLFLTFLKNDFFNIIKKKSFSLSYLVKTKINLKLFFLLR